MARFVVGYDRGQSTLFPERLDDYLGEDNPVRAWREAWQWAVTVQAA